MGKPLLKVSVAKVQDTIDSDGAECRLINRVNTGVDYRRDNRHSIGQLSYFSQVDDGILKWRIRKGGAR